jgi:RNA recognition motif-containing protein
MDNYEELQRKSVKITNLNKNVTKYDLEAYLSKVGDI